MKKVLKKIVYLSLSALPKPDEAHPGKLYLRWRVGWIKGILYKIAVNLNPLAPRIYIGKKFSLQGCLKVRGSGEIRLGNNVIIDDRTTLFTHSQEALITVGDHTFLNGTRMGCDVRISIGSHCIIADARIMDTDFHSLALDRHHPNAVILKSPVEIQNNVWIAAQSAILKGVVVGQNSVVGFGSVVLNGCSENSIIAGNPAKFIKHL